VTRFLLVLLAAAVVAPTAAAAHVRFSVRIEGTVDLSWRDTATYSSGGCSVTDTFEGGQRVEFQSAHASVVTLDVRKGRVRFTKPLTLRALMGVVSGGGQETLHVCDQMSIADLECDTSEIRAGTAELSADASGRLGLSNLRAPRLAAAPACIPGALRPAQYPPLERARASVDRRKLLRRRTSVVTATDQGIVRLAAEGETGSLSRQVRWRLTFHRLTR
jgi:hypothetical protein